MNRTLSRLALGATSIAVAALAVAIPGTAQATTPGPSFQTCKNLAGWYANPDEQSDLPTPTVDGLKFEGKDLIHHATDPLDFTDFDKTGKSFEATAAGKVVFKAETSGPYSTIVINADGKIWSTAFKYEAVGGQGNPVAKAEDLIGKPDSMKPGKVPYTAASRIVTFGVGYRVEEDSTVVSSISFHGTKYPLICKTATAGPTATPTKTPIKPTPSKAATSRPATTPAGAIGGGDGAGGLPVTGVNVPMIAGGGALILLSGGALLFLVRRRKVDFSA